jgi:hypothetical protein
MPALRHRAVLELMRNAKAFFTLDASLTGREVPDPQHQLEVQARKMRQVRKRTESQAQRIEQLLERLSRKQRRTESRARAQTEKIERLRGQLSEKGQVVERLRAQLADKDRRLVRLQEELTIKDRRLRAAQELHSRESQTSVTTRVNGPETKDLEHPEDELYVEVKEVLDRIPVDFGGGCTLEKAYMMACLIREYDLKRTVDIGVYRGRSLFPQALAHRRFTGGIVYGVDPWSASEAREKDNAELKEAIDRWVEDTDFQAVYEEVEALMHALRYEDHCVLLRQTSARAAAHFEGHGTSFDMIHIDGNHDTDNVVEDVSMYLPRLNHRGYIILDDISWESVKPAYGMLTSKLSLLFEQTARSGDYAVFWNHDAYSGVAERRRFIESVAKMRSSSRR